MSTHTTAFFNWYRNATLAPEPLTLSRRKHWDKHHLCMLSISNYFIRFQASGWIKRITNSKRYKRHMQNDYVTFITKWNNYTRERNIFRSIPRMLLKRFCQEFTGLDQGLRIFSKSFIPIESVKLRLSEMIVVKYYIQSDFIPVFGKAITICLISFERLPGSHYDDQVSKFIFSLDWCGYLA